VGCSAGPTLCLSMFKLWFAVIAIAFLIINPASYFTGGFDLINPASFHWWFWSGNEDVVIMTFPSLLLHIVGCSRLVLSLLLHVA